MLPLSDKIKTVAGLSQALFISGLSLVHPLIKPACVWRDCLSVFIGDTCQKVVSTAVITPPCGALPREPRAASKKLL